MTPDEAFALIEEAYADEDAYVRYMQCFLGLLRTLDSSDIPVAHRAIEVATRYWGPGATDSDLEAARVCCWRSIDELIPGCRGEAVLRLTLLVLYPVGPDLMDSLGFVERWASRLGISTARLVEELTAFFPKALHPARSPDHG